MDTRFVMSSGNDETIYHKIENRLYPVWRNVGKTGEVYKYIKFYNISSDIKLTPVNLLKTIKRLLMTKGEQ